MDPFWKSSTGKLVIGGCGTQIGLLFTFGGLIIILLFCSVCVSLNVLSASLTQELAGQTGQPLIVPSEPTSSPAEIESTLAEINLVLAEIELLRAKGVVIPGLGQAESNPAAKPVVLVNQGGVELYSGPGSQYSQVGVLPAGEQLEIVGRNSDSAWWLVARPNGLFAWVSSGAVTSSNVNNTIPVVTIPDQLVQPASSGPFVDTTTSITATATPRPTPTLPPGTPTPTLDQERQYVEDMSAYQRVKAALLVPPVSASLSPDGSKIALTERIKLYTVTTAGAHTDILLADDDTTGPLGGAVWSPDGGFLAYVVGFKDPKCGPCRSVAVQNLSDGSIIYLETSDGLETDAPRWTQDGRLLVNAHPGEPADGTTYVFDRYGLGQEASGTYILSSSHDGQKWYPWLPGRIWRAGVSERPDSYYSD
jgi:uncharacterized protein YraI